MFGVVSWCCFLLLIRVVVLGLIVLVLRVIDVVYIVLIGFFDCLLEVFVCLVSILLVCFGFGYCVVLDLCFGWGVLMFGLTGLLTLVVWFVGYCVICCDGLGCAATYCWFGCDALRVLGVMTSSLYVGCLVL